MSKPTQLVPSPITCLLSIDWPFKFVPSFGPFESEKPSEEDKGLRNSWPAPSTG